MDLTELPPEKARELVNDKMRKDLQAAFEMAAESQPLSYYKDILIKFQEELAAEPPAPVKKAAKKAGKAAADGEDEDVTMADAEDADEAAVAKKEKTKKRKAEEAAEVWPLSESQRLHH